jgi:putative endonuclease
MASKCRGSLYIGVTSDLVRRAYEHRNELIEGFTKKHKINTLVYYEVFDNVKYAIAREKQLKNWHRDWKINLIERMNLYWEDLYMQITK